MHNCVIALTFIIILSVTHKPQVLVNVDPLIHLYIDYTFVTEQLF